MVMDHFEDYILRSKKPIGFISDEVVEAAHEQTDDKVKLLGKRHLFRKAWKNAFEMYSPHKQLQYLKVNSVLLSQF